MAVQLVLFSLLSLVAAVYADGEGLSACPAFETGETFVGSLKNIFHNPPRGSLLARHNKQTPWVCCHRCESSHPGCFYWSWIARGRDVEGNLLGECAYFGEKACTPGSNGEMPFDPSNNVAYSGSVHNCRDNEATKLAKIAYLKRAAERRIARSVESQSVNPFVDCPTFEYGKVYEGVLRSVYSVEGKSTAIETSQWVDQSAEQCAAACDSVVPGCAYWSWLPNNPDTKQGACMFFNEHVCDSTNGVKTFHPHMAGALSGTIRKAEPAASITSEETASAVVEESHDNTVEASVTNAVATVETQAIPESVAVNQPEVQAEAATVVNKEVVQEAEPAVSAVNSEPVEVDTMKQLETESDKEVDAAIKAQIDAVIALPSSNAVETTVLPNTVEKVEVSVTETRAVSSSVEPAKVAETEAKDAETEAAAEVEVVSVESAVSTIEPTAEPKATVASVMAAVPSQTIRVQDVRQVTALVQEAKNSVSKSLYKLSSLEEFWKTVTDEETVEEVKPARTSFASVPNSAAATLCPEFASGEYFVGHLRRAQLISQAAVGNRTVIQCCRTCSKTNGCQWWSWTAASEGETQGACALFGADACSVGEDGRLPFDASRIFALSGAPICRPAAVAVKSTVLECVRKMLC
eukprot:TRINITY_DN374_c0_g1_i3.p1 TRINITY_DN374_c0_g1~~TRINITY_DN374_c0_g1_i3.p1  ORF type:complete len:636 (+),score=107.99 TRINITY_DN374_c0_g1_i3:109-2016(+)